MVRLRTLSPPRRQVAWIADADDGFPDSREFGQAADGELSHRSTDAVRSAAHPAASAASSSKRGTAPVAAWMRGIGDYLKRQLRAA